MKTTHLALALGLGTALAATSLPAHAAAPPAMPPIQPYALTSGLLQICQNPQAKMACGAYIMGALDSSSLVNGINGGTRRICLPVPHPDSDRLFDRIVAQIQDLVDRYHEVADGPAVAAIMAVLEGDYPCPATGARR